MAQEFAAVRDGKVIEVLGTTEHESAQFSSGAHCTGATTSSRSSVPRRPATRST